jgi:hypothetical protein
MGTPRSHHVRKVIDITQVRKTGDVITGNAKDDKIHNYEGDGNENKNNS